MSSASLNDVDELPTDDEQLAEQPEEKQESTPEESETGIEKVNVEQLLESGEGDGGDGGENIEEAGTAEATEGGENIEEAGTEEATEGGENIEEAGTAEATEGGENIEEAGTEEATEGGDEETEQVEEEQPEVLISEDFISKIFLGEECTLPENLFEFDHSYGYDCTRYFNVCLPDEETIIFASGNLIHFFNIPERRLWFRRSAGGGGIGHITKNPCQPHIAVGEKGINPFIIIYEWPSMEIVSLLRDGTMTEYSHLDYSPDGMLLCSQGGDPDYMLTIWNWEKSRLMLRRKAHTQTVVNAKFSPYVPGQLTSGGIGHIRFWKMAQTFTGLKLNGELGRFGKTEMSDIYGFLPLPDEKVVSGCEWGNMLVWDEGLIKVEVFRKNRKPCHEKAIVQFEFDNGELCTVGRDGVIKFWYFETIDQADPPEEDRSVEVEPMYEFQIGTEGHPAELMSMVKRRIELPEDNEWIAQDGNGGLWNVSLNVNEGEESHEQILYTHAGPVVGLAASPCHPHLASIGKDGRIQVYHYIDKKLLIRKQYFGGGSCLLWLPMAVDPTGTVILAGFGDGVLRVIVVTTRTTDRLTLIQVTKPHNKAITAIDLNPRGNLLVTGGDDGTIFIHVVLSKGEYVDLSPAGLISVPSSVTFINWKPDNPDTAIICCKLGQLLEIELPDKIVPATAITFKLDNVPMKQLRFVSVKAMIRRQIKLREIEKRKNEKREKKKENLQKLRAENPGLDIDEETFLEDSDSEEELEPLFFPEVPNPILFAMYTPSNTLWLSMGGYDSGYIYEYDFYHNQPLQSTMVHDGDDTEIHSYAYYHNRQYLFLGMQDGKIRANRVNPDDFRDLKNYSTLPMHDNGNGVIHKICFSYDQRYMFSCGNDGNVFSYGIHPEGDDYIKKYLKPRPTFETPREDVRDIDDDTVLSLEEMKIKMEYDRKMATANQRKQEVLEMLAELSERYRIVVEKNQRLPESLRLTAEELDVDERTTEAVKRLLQDEMDLLQRKMAYQAAKSEMGLKKIHDYFVNCLEYIKAGVKAIDKDYFVRTFRNRHVFSGYTEMKKKVEILIEWEDAKGRLQPAPLTKALSQVKEKKMPRSEVFLKSINLKPNERKNNLRIRRLLNYYLARRHRIETREEEWGRVQLEKPDPTAYHPMDILAIELAEKSVGDYKLKSAPDYTVPKHLRMTTLKKYKEMMETRMKLFKTKSLFNRKVIDLRKEKLDMIELVTSYHKQLDVLDKEIGTLQIKERHAIPEIDASLEMLDKEFVIHRGDSLQKKLRQMHLEKKKKKLTLLKTICPEYQQEIDPLFESLGKGSFNFNLSETLALSQHTRASFEAHSQVALEVLEKAAMDDSIDTPWEKETRQSRAIEKLGLQDQLCRIIDNKILKFDIKVRTLTEEKRVVQKKAKFLELHLLKLNQEMLILKKFESREQFLSNRVTRRHRERHKEHANIIGLEGQIDQKNKETMKHVEDAAEITTSFNDAVADSKFATFLRKIYKKRYKPPKPPRDEDDESDESSSSDDSSTDDEEDARSIDSREIGPIRLDDTICPDGCEPDLYDLAFNLRSERHQLEINMADIKKLTEGLNKLLEAAQKSLIVLDAALQESQNDLEEFQREKQQRLNEVDVLVVFSYHNLSHFKERHKLEILENTLLFSKGILRNLNYREAQLLEEMKLHKERHKRNRRHLQRMKTDCAFMAEKNFDMKREIVENKIIKFGSDIVQDELEEAVIRRMIIQMRANVDNYRKEQEKLLFNLDSKIRYKENMLCCLMKNKTEKVNTIIALEIEHQKLTKQLKFQEDNQGKTGFHEEPFSKDNVKLQDLVKYQSYQIQDLREEIRVMKLKSKTEPVRRSRPVQHKQLRQPDEVEESDVSEEEDVDSEDIEKILETVDSNELYMQALLDEVIQALPKDGQEKVLSDLESSIEKLPAKDQDAAKKAVAELMSQFPSRNREDLSENELMVLEILEQLVEDPDGIRDILEAIVNNIIPDEVEEEFDIQMIASTVVEELVELTLTQGEEKQQLVKQVSQTLDQTTGGPPDMENVRAVVIEILKLDILDKLGIEEGDDEELYHQAEIEEGDDNNIEENEDTLIIEEILEIIDDEASQDIEEDGQDENEYQEVEEAKSTEEESEAEETTEDHQPTNQDSDHNDLDNI